MITVINQIATNQLLCESNLHVTVAPSSFPKLRLTVVEVFVQRASKVCWCLLFVNVESRRPKRNTDASSSCPWAIVHINVGLDSDSAFVCVCGAGGGGGGGGTR